MEQNPAKTTPVERRIARDQQSAAMRERALALRQAGQTYAAIGVELGVCLERARRVVLKAKRLTEHPRWFDALPARAVNLLARCGLDTLPESEAAQAVGRLTPKELLAHPNFGRGALEALVAWLAARGLSLSGGATTENKKGVPEPGRPRDSHNPLPAGRKASSKCDMARIAP